jgi:hypothetical protein
MTKTRLSVVFAAAVLLMLIRVDFWWWGEVSPPVLFGWLTAPMLYHLGIWFSGWMLVLYAANHLWTDQ